MSPILLGQPNADGCIAFDSAPQSGAMPYRMRIEQAACIDHDDIAAAMSDCATRRCPDEGGRRRSRPSKSQGRSEEWRNNPRYGRGYGQMRYDDRRYDVRPRRYDDRNDRYDRGYDDRRPRRIELYDDRYDDQPVRHRGGEDAPKAKGEWKGLLGSAIGLGGVAAIGGGAFMGVMGLSSLMHHAARGPSLALLLGGALLAVGGWAALKAAMSD